MSVDLLLPGERPFSKSDSPRLSEALLAYYDMVRVPVDSGTVIAVGDLCYLETDDLRPASDQFDQGTLSLNQQTFHGLFAGVALEASASGDVFDVAIATRGQFISPISGTPPIVGDLVGVTEVGGTVLSNDVLAEVSSVSASVGLVMEAIDSGSSRVLLVSTIFHRGVQVAQ